MSKVKHWKERVNWKVIALFPLVPLLIGAAVAPKSRPDRSQSVHSSDEAG